MMKITGKYTKDGKIVAYDILDEGLSYKLAERTLYHELYYSSLIESGYKYNDYHGNINDSEGNPIQDIEESSNYLSDTELLQLLDDVESLESGLISESDFVSNNLYTKTFETIEVLTPENPPIKTRDEFVKYLDSLSKAKNSNVNQANIVPLNSLVSQDALFTLEDLAINKDDAMRLFVRYFENNVITSILELKKFEDFYQLNFDKEDINYKQSILEFLKKYFSYGIPGIKANITNIQYILNPTESIRDISKNIDTYVRLKYGILNTNNNYLYSEDVNGINYYDLEGEYEVDTNAHIGDTSLSQGERKKLKNSYMLVPYGFKRVMPRIKIEAISEDGIKVTFIADCDEAHLYRGTTHLTPTLNMFSFKTIDDSIIPISRIFRKGEEYIKDTVLIKSYIKDKIKRTAIEPKYSSTFNLMMGIGVSPYYAPSLAAELIGKGVYSSLEIPDAKEFSDLHYNCGNILRTGFSNKILNKYGDDTPEFMELPLISQIEAINDNIEVLQSTNSYQIEPEIGKGGIKLGNSRYMEWFDEVNANEVNNANFSISILNGIHNIGELAFGMDVDNGGSIEKMFLMFLSLYYMSKQEDSSLSITEFLDDDFISEFLDLDDIFKPKDHAYRGCIKDEIFLRSMMAEQSNTLCFVNKVFRENSNDEVDKSLRHFAIEFATINKERGSEGFLIFKTLSEQMIAELTRRKLTSYTYFVGEIVTQVIFELSQNSAKISESDGVVTITKLVRFDDDFSIEIKFKLSSKIHFNLKNHNIFEYKYCSCYDYCENQFSKADMKCNVYTINASINPWAVIPREGFKIPEYNIVINSYSIDELSSYVPQTVLDRIVNSQSKVVKSLKNEYSANELFPTMSSIFSYSEQVERARNGLFLNISEYEDLDCYLSRTMFDINTAKNNKQSLKTSILKSDLVYELYKPFCWIDDVETENIFYPEYDSKLNNKHISNMLPRILTNTWYTGLKENIKSLPVSSNGVKITRISFDSIAFIDKVYNNDLCYSKIKTETSIFISQGALNILGKEVIKLSDLNKDKLIKLADNNFAIRLSNNVFLIKMINGLVKLEV